MKPNATLPTAWGEHLAAFDWTHVATLTTTHPTPATHLTWLFARFVRHLEQVTQEPIPWFRTLEGSERDCHLHALLAGTQRLTNRQIECRWTHGHTRITRYDPSREAASYVSKALASMPDHYDVSRRPPRRLVEGTRMPRRKVVI